MADPKVVDYIRQHLSAYGPDVLRQHLRQQGVADADVDAAMKEALPVMPPLMAVPAPPPPGALPPTVPLSKTKRSRRGVVIGALLGGLALMGLSVFMGRQKPKDGTTPAAAPSELPSEGSVFHGQNEFILKLPPGYEARSSFRDAEKTMEVVYAYRKGTDAQHFINDGLYEHLGILRLEILPRRVPQGLIGIDTLQEWVIRQLDGEKARYESRLTVVNGMSAFIVTVTKPFQFRKAYVVGEKMRYTLIGGHENPVFDEVLATLAETGGQSHHE
ncbi:MAG: hypothetical protein HYZ75_18265 [Elusimicrobia bacterium]|nr:hypothetical protein [Elusimicrobiota bacterium]